MINDKLDTALSNAMECPFCGNKKLDMSLRSGHVSVHCKRCYAYGPRILEYSKTKKDDNGRFSGKIYFKNKKDADNNTDDDGILYKKSDDSDVPYEWYYEEAVRRWNSLVKKSDFIEESKDGEQKL